MRNFFKFSIPCALNIFQCFHHVILQFYKFIYLIISRNYLVIILQNILIGYTSIFCNLLLIVFHWETDVHCFQIGTGNLGHESESAWSRECESVIPSSFPTSLSQLSISNCSKLNVLLTHCDAVI